MKTFRTACLAFVLVAIATAAPATAAGESAESGMVTGLFMRESDHLFVEKALWRSTRPAPLWVEVALPDEHGVIRRKMFRGDAALGNLAVGDYVAVKNAAASMPMRGLLAGVDHVTGIISRKDELAVVSGAR